MSQMHTIKGYHVPSPSKSRDSDSLVFTLDVRITDFPEIKVYGGNARAPNLNNPAAKAMRKQLMTDPVNFFDLNSGVIIAPSKIYMDLDKVKKENSPSGVPCEVRELQLQFDESSGWRSFHGIINGGHTSLCILSVKREMREYLELLGTESRTEAQEQRLKALEGMGHSQTLAAELENTFVRVKIFRGQRSESASSLLAFGAPREETIRSISTGTNTSTQVKPFCVDLQNGEYDFLQESIPSSFEHRLYIKENENLIPGNEHKTLFIESVVLLAILASDKVHPKTIYSSKSSALRDVKNWDRYERKKTADKAKRLLSVAEAIEGEVLQDKEIQELLAKYEGTRSNDSLTYLGQDREGKFFASAYIFYASLYSVRDLLGAFPDSRRHQTESFIKAAKAGLLEALRYYVKTGGQSYSSKIGKEDDIYKAALEAASQVFIMETNSPGSSGIHLVTSPEPEQAVSQEVPQPGVNMPRQTNTENILDLL
jgi:hypothetical protein